MPEYINRPPRIQPELPAGEREIPNPPSREGAAANGGMMLIQIGLPLISILGYVLVSGGRGGSSILFVLPMALSVMATSAVGILTYLRSIQLDREKQRIYAQRLIELRREMIASHDQQRAFYMHNYPDMDTILRMTNTPDGSVDSRLWERRTKDNDFGAVRIGMGTMPSTVVYKSPGIDQTADAPQLFDALKLADDSRFVRNIPITVPLRPISGDQGGSEDKNPDPAPLGVKLPQIGRFAIGIAGGDRKIASNFVRAMFVNYTAFHSPNDTRLYVIGSKDAQADWEWAKWMPHCNTSRNESGKGDQLAFDPKKARRIWDILQGELERRQLRMQDENAPDVSLPFIVVVIDALSATAKDSPLDAVSTEATVSLMLNAGPQLGAALVFLVPKRDMVPSECRAVVECELQEGVPNFRYAEVGLNTLRFDGVADTVDSRRADLEFSRKLASKVLRSTYGSDIANSVNLLELFSIRDEKNYDTVNKFPLLDWWRFSRKPENSEWMKVPIGLMGGNKVRELLFAADGDGVHGMVAGTTGSGKSELLLTVVVGLAMRYDPSVINFVLADYKGGTAFDPFKTLPHAVDIVTSLQGLAGVRTFIATKAEMNRRSAMIANSNTKHIVHYRQKNLHVTREPFPFLFIIVDEFAEMVKENPETKGYLDSITRLGRALGVTLILATQRPAGVVTDQMRSNIKWRICLRVETAEDSRELLKRSDAAFLPNNIPGRGYLQVGSDNVELMQVARAGAPFTGDQEETEPAVIWINRGTSAISAASASKGPASEAPAISDLLVALMARLASENDDIVPQKKPWPDPLPNLLTLDQERLPKDIERNPLLPLNSAVIDWLEGEGNWNGVDWEERSMRTSIGLIDQPIQARQLPLTIDFNKGHAMAFGASGWGKTQLLRTLAISLASTHSPQEMHIYIMDFGGKGLDVLRDLPHTASVVLPSEDERVVSTLRRLKDELEQRKAILSQARVDNLAIYNAGHKEKVIPALLVIIDNFAEFRENYENQLPELMNIVRDARSAGIHFIITSQQPNAVPNKLYNMITVRMTFRLADPTEYSNVVGRAMPHLPEIAGRGFIPVENDPLEMQVAMPVHLTQEDEVMGLDNTKKLAQLVKIMNDTWGDRPRPQSVDLVKVLSLMELFSFQDKTEYQKVEDFPIMEWWRKSRKPENAEWMRAPLGLVTGNKVRALVFAADADGSHGMVAGTTGSGKSELLLTLVAGVAMRYDPSVVNFILADYKGGSAFDPFRGLPHAVDIVSNLQGLAGARTFTAMRAEMNRRSKLLADTQTKHTVHYRQKNLHETREPFPFLFIIVDEFAEMVKENPEFKGNIDSITRLGRALGMMLILATQRPAGVVTDQMRSNMKWRVCLRVETAEDSRELLKRDDAAYLANTIPGRGYLQVGNEPIEMMQVARAGGPYTGPVPEYLRKPDEADQPTSAADAPILSNLLTAMMKHFSDTYPEVAPQKKPYPDPLPLKVTLDQIRLETDIDPTNPLMPLSPEIFQWLHENRRTWDGISWNRNALRANVGLVDNPARAEQLPLSFNLNKGHVAVFGASGWGKTILLRSLVIALAASHSPKELNVYMLDFGGKGLDVLTDLPHVACSILPSEDDRVAALIRRLQDELEQRKALLSSARADSLPIYNSTHPERVIPAILVLIDNFAEYRENYENLLPELMAIVRDARANGIHFVVTGQVSNVMPGKLYNMFSERMSFRLTDPTEYANVIGSHMPHLPEIPGRGFTVVENVGLEMQVALPAALTDQDKAEGLDYTKKLAQLIGLMKDAWGEGPRPQSVDLVKQLSLIDLFNFLDKDASYQAVEDFPIREWWAKSRKPENSEWLRGVIGLVTGNKVRSLVFAADADGTHGMVAGTTGSGKSELLLTLVAGMAMRYDPSVVNFILADYKGGAAFDPFRGLPHAVDIVSNLQGLAGMRTFNAMKAEMNRRSKLLADSRTKHIVEYRKKNMHETREPFPFLFVIVDEFAEMVKENPDVKGMLDSITRLGRALGVTLILATQRPAGVVTDQMRSNIKWRICLRVETADDSRELLKRNDAAYLPNNIPGRAFLQVGNENIELMQVARAGGPYTGPLPEYLQRPVEDGEAQEAPALTDTLTKMMEWMQKTYPEVKVQKKPYPDPLPLRLTLDQDHLPTDVQQNPLLPVSPAMVKWMNGEGAWEGIDWANEAMRACIGLIDYPIQAIQLPLNVNLNRGHIVLFGASGFGKTVFLRTLVMALAAKQSPKELHIYAFDFGGKGLDVISDLPHFSAPPIASGEDERIQRLLRKLSNEIEARKALLSRERAENLAVYNAANPDKVLPAILVLIDNFVEIKENYENLLPEFISLMRDGRANGVHFAVTADVPGSMGAKTFALFSERLTVKLSDAQEYTTIVGRGVPGAPQDPGRGLVEYQRQALEMHVALPVGATPEEQEKGLDDVKKLAKIVEVMAKAWGDGPRPEKIDVLRPVVALRSILPAKPKGKAVEAILGIEDANLQPASFDLLARGPHFTIIGPPLSGKTTALRSWVLSMAEVYDPNRVMMVLVDFRRRFFNYGGQRSLADLPHVVAAVTDLPQMNEAIANLRAEYETPDRDFKKYPRPEIFIISDNYDEWASVIGSSVSTRSTAYRDLSDLANRYGPDGFHAVLGGSLAITRNQDEFLRKVLESRYGFGIDTGESASALGGRVRSTGQAAEFPPGRGYIVRSGRVSLMQVAQPFEGESMEESLDQWVTSICEKYPTRAFWFASTLPKPEQAPEQAAQAQAQPAGTPAPLSFNAAQRATSTNAAVSGGAAGPDFAALAKQKAEQEEALKGLDDAQKAAEAAVKVAQEWEQRKAAAAAAPKRSQAEIDEGRFKAEVKKFGEAEATRRRKIREQTRADLAASETQYQKELVDLTKQLGSDELAQAEAARLRAAREEDILKRERADLDSAPANGSGNGSQVQPVKEGQ